MTEQGKLSSMHQQLLSAAYVNDVREADATENLAGPRDIGDVLQCCSANLGNQ